MFRDEDHTALALNLTDSSRLWARATRRGRWRSSLCLFRELNRVTRFVENSDDGGGGDDDHDRRRHHRDRKLHEKGARINAAATRLA